MMEPKSPRFTHPTTTTSYPQQHHRIFIMVENILRILAILLSAASVVVTVTNHQTVYLFDTPLEAHFYYSSSFKFFVAANGVVCVLSVLTLIINLLLRQQAYTQQKHYYFFLFLHDMGMTVLLIAGCAAATAIGYVGQYGEKHMFWLPICDHVRNFCTTSLVSVLLSYFAFFAYLGLTILIAYKCTFLPPTSAVPF